MKVYISRVYSDQVTVNVIPNVVEGDCCENQLEIETLLRFCKTFACNEYLASPLTVERKGDIFVEHSIASVEF